MLPTLTGNKQEHLNLLACAVFDEETGRMLNYRQLLTHPKYKEVWTTSSADKFGRLAQGVGGRIEGTNTIYLSHTRKFHVTASEILRMADLFAISDWQKTTQIERD